MIGVTSQEEAFEECYMVSDQKSYFELCRRGKPVLHVS